MRLVYRIDRELTHPLAFASGPGNQVYAYELATSFGYGRGQLAKGLLTGIEFDSDGDAVLS
jgi:hypothetical protein